MRKSIFRINHTHHNCFLESSHLENPSVLEKTHKLIFHAKRPLDISGVRGFADGHFKKSVKIDF